MFWQQILYLALYEFGKSGEWPSQLKIGMEKINLNLTSEQKELIEDTLLTMENLTLSELEKIQKENPEIYCEIIFEDGKYKMFEHSKKAIIKGIISQFKKGQEAKPKK
jgi:hypothetical protein